MEAAGTDNVRDGELGSCKHSRQENVARSQLAVIVTTAFGGATSAACHVQNRRDCVSDQTSIFSAISMASSTAIPRYRTVLSILEWPS